MLLYILSRLGSICRGLAFAKAWHSILYLVTPWQYLQRLGILVYILSRLGSICRGLAFYSISCHALEVSGEAWHSALYLVTPWKYLARLVMPFYILSRDSRLGSIWRCLAWYSISHHALYLPGEAWHAILYLFTPWQYLQRLGILLYILSHLGSICRGLACFSILSPTRLGIQVETERTIPD